VAPNAEVVFGATIDPLMKDRAQVILVATGLGGQPLSDVMAHASDVMLRRPATPQVEQDAVPPTPASGEEAPIHLAEALFSQAIASAKASDEPWAVTEAPTPRHNLNDLDVPAFLRRRRTLRDIERSQ
jgi:hypothetical protein